MTDFDAVDFFTDTSLVNDPYSYFEHLRAQGPVARLPQRGVVAVTGHDEAIDIFRDVGTFSSCNSVTGPLPGFPVQLEGDDVSALIEQHRHRLPMSEYLITQDPPEHEKHRGLLMRLLTPKRLKENEDFMWRLADRQIDGFIDASSFEVMRDFAKSFSGLVIADLLGLPEEDHKEFRAHLGEEQAVPEMGDKARRVAKDPLAFLFDKFSAYVEERRREPRNDVLTQMATVTYPDGTTPEIPVVVHTATFLFAAGQHTTAVLITTALRILAERPDLQERLRGAPEHIPHFVQETLRMEGPVKTMSRMARSSTSLAGVEIPAGTTVSIFPQAANRDPRRFEAPKEFQLDRSKARAHLGFGWGIHTCPGAALAETETCVAIERLLARTSDIRISEAHHGPPGDRRFEYVPTYILHGLTELHLEFTPATDAR